MVKRQLNLYFSENNPEHIASTRPFSYFSFRLRPSVNSQIPRGEDDPNQDPKRYGRHRGPVHHHRCKDPEHGAGMVQQVRGHRPRS